VTAILQQHKVPEEILELGALDRVDYVDLFTAPLPAPRPVERLARSALEGSPVVRLFGPLVWQVVLGLRMDRRPSPDRIAGWMIADRGEHWIRLEAGSWFMTAHVVVHADGGQLSVATLVRYDRPFAKVFWPRAAIVHRRAMPGLLRSAIRAS
jgi:hypothetical protein